ncbi:MAG: FAD-dependent oxidoreductase [Dehalococcoidia bacterium]
MESRTRPSSILQPIRIGAVDINNRIAMAPMGIEGLVEPDGNLSKRAIDYYTERAKGGAGLIITGLFKVENEIDVMPAGTSLASETGLAPLAELAEAVHALGSKIFVQLTAGFGRVRPPLGGKRELVSASAIPGYWTPEITCRELTTGEIERIVECFGQAATLLARAGVDGIEVHAVHEGYLLDQFAISLFNRRTDKYGGDLRNRLRFATDLVKEVKTRAGNSFAVGLRFSVKSYVKDWNKGGLPGEEFEEKGRDVQEGLEAAAILEEAGYEALNADAGTYDAWYWAHPPTYQQHGCYLPLTEKLKEVVNIPVIVAGRMEVPELAEKALNEGKADMVALGRGLLADPQWVRKVQENKPDRIRPCMGCHDGCLGRLASGKGLSCAVNPAAGRENDCRINPANEPKKVMVIGGGIAGLEAARVAALRGHHVNLYEKSGHLGGHLIEASVPDFKRDYERLLNWYKLELETLNMPVQLNTEVTPETVAKQQPDVTIIATGSFPASFDIPGLAEHKVATATEALLGKKEIGQRTLVVGGGLIGCETALWLAQQGKEVTIVEMLGELMSAGMPVPHPNRVMLLDLLKYHKIDVLTNHKLLEVVDGKAVLVDNGHRKTQIDIDGVVMSIGLNLEKELYNSLSGRIPNLYVIGDANEVRNVMGAIWDAYEVARAI